MQLRLFRAALALFILNVPGIGQSSGSEDQVIVTATRFEDTYRDKPVNVTVIEAEEIERSPARTVPELLATSAGVNLRDFFGNNAASTTVDLRGFGALATQNTLVLVDGRRAADNDLSGVQWAAIPLADIERIEIVRGGGAVQYGDGAVAGVVNIITKGAARAAPSARVAGTTGTYNTWGLQAGATYGSEAIGLSLDATRFLSDGYRDNNENRQSTIGASVRWGDGPLSLDLRASADHQDLRLPGARRVDPALGIDEVATDPQGTSTPLDFSTRNGYRAAAELNVRGEPVELSVGLGYRGKEQTANFQNRFVYREDDVGVWSFTPRVRFPSKVFGLDNTLVLGVDLYRWDYALDASDSPANIGRPTNRVTARQSNDAVYVFDTVRLNSYTTVSAGYRTERFQLEATDVFDPTAPGAVFGSGAPSGEQDESQYAWELGARIQLSPQYGVIARAQRSYRFATVDEVYEFSGPPTFSREFQFLRPQTALGYELGLERANQGLFVRAAAFLIDVTDEIHLDPFTAGVGNTNLPPTRRQGVEFEADWQAARAVGLGLRYAYTDARFRSGVLPGDPFTTQNVDLAGKRVPLVPEHLVSASVTWHILPALQGVANATYASDQLMENDEGNTFPFRIPAYALLGLKLSYLREGWLLTLSVNNVLGERYYNYAIRSASSAIRYDAYPLPGRTISASVEYRFR